jgi:hypothetical protein
VQSPDILLVLKCDIIIKGLSFFLASEVSLLSLSHYVVAFQFIFFLSNECVGTVLVRYALSFD